MSITDRLTPWLSRALDLSYRRQNVLAGNIANVDTGAYVPQDLDFRGFLADELARSQRGEAPAGAAPEPIARPSAPPRLDGNQVDLDHEAAAAAANRLFYELASEITTRRLAMVRYAIDEGGR